MSYKDELLSAIRAQVAKAKRVTAVEIDGFTYYVRGRTVGEIDQQRISDDAWIKDHTLSAAAALVMCGQDGELLFDPNDEKDSKLIQELFGVSWVEFAQKLVDAATAGKEVKEGN